MYRLSVGGRITGQPYDDFEFFGEYDAVMWPGSSLQQTVSVGASYKF